MSGSTAAGVQRRVLPSLPSTAGLVDVSQVEQRPLQFGIRLMCVNPTNHIIAVITTKNDLVIYNSTSWSQIFRKYAGSEGFQATCMAWRFDSRLLSVGYANGKIGMTDVEDGKEVYKLALTDEAEKSFNNAVSLLSWLPSGGWSKQGGGCEPRNHLNPYVFRLHNFLDSAIPLPKKTNAGGNTSGMLAEKTKVDFLNSEAKLFNQTRLSFLAAWYNPSRIVLYAYGLYAVMDLDFHLPSLRWTLRTADCVSISAECAQILMPLAIAMSADHRDLMLSSVVGAESLPVAAVSGQNEAQSEQVIQNTSIDTSILYYGFYELEAITFRMCKIDAYFEFIEKILAQIDESCAFVSDDGLEVKLRDFLRNRQPKLIDFSSRYDRPLAANTLDILLTDLVELLTVGIMDEELEILVRTALTPDAVRRLASNLERAYTKLRDLCVVHLQPALEAVMLLFDELRVFNCMPQKFRAFLGGSFNPDAAKPNICTCLFQTSASLLLKAKEFVCVIDQCVVNMRAFFEWVFVDLELLVTMPDGEVGHAWGFRGGIRNQNQHHQTTHGGVSTAGANRGGAGRNHPQSVHTAYAQENEGRAAGLGFTGAYASGSNAVGSTARANVHNNAAAVPSGKTASSPAEEVRLHRLAANANLSLGVGMGGTNDTVTCVLEFIRDTFSHQVLLGSSDSSDNMPEYGRSAGNSKKNLRLERVGQYLRDAPLEKCYPFCTATVAADVDKKPTKYDVYTPGIWSTLGVSLLDDAVDAVDVDDINEFSHRFVDFGSDDGLNIDERVAEQLEQNRQALLRQRDAPLKHTLYRVERTKSLKQLFVQLRRHTKTILLPAITRSVSAKVAINGTFPLIKLSEAENYPCSSSSNGKADCVPRLQLSCYERFLPHSTTNVTGNSGNKFITAVQVAPHYAEKLLLGANNPTTNNAPAENAGLSDAAANNADQCASAGMLLVIRHDIIHSKLSMINVVRDAHFLLENNDEFEAFDVEKEGSAEGLKLCSMLPAPSTNKVQHRVVLVNVTLPMPHPQKIAVHGGAALPAPLSSSPRLTSFTYLQLTDQLMLLMRCNNESSSTSIQNNSSAADAAYLYYISLPQILADQSSSSKVKISNESYPSATLLEFVAKTAKTFAEESAEARNLVGASGGGDRVDASTIVPSSARDDRDVALEPRRLQFAENMDVADAGATTDDKCFVTIQLPPVSSNIAKDNAQKAAVIHAKTQMRCVPCSSSSVIQVVCMQKLAIVYDPYSAGTNSNRIALACLQPSIRARRAAEMCLYNSSATTSSSSTNVVAGEADLYCCERSNVGNGMMRNINKPLSVCNSHDEMLQGMTQSLFADLCLPQRFEYDASLAQRARRFAAGLMRTAATAVSKQKKPRGGNAEHAAEKIASNDDAAELENDDESSDAQDDDDSDNDERLTASIFAQLDAVSAIGMGCVKQPDNSCWLSDSYAAVETQRIDEHSTSDDADSDDDDFDDWASFMRHEAEANSNITSSAKPQQQRSKLFSASSRQTQHYGNSPFAELAATSAFIDSTIHKRTHSSLSLSNARGDLFRSLRSGVDELESRVAAGENRRQTASFVHR